MPLLHLELEPEPTENGPTPQKLSLKKRCYVAANMVVK